MSANQPPSPGRGWLALLTSPLAVAAGYLLRALIEPFHADPAALVAITLAACIAAENVALVVIWLAGIVVHRREYLDVRNDRDRLRGLIEAQTHMLDVTVPRAVEGHPP